MTAADTVLMEGSQYLRQNLDKLGTSHARPLSRLAFRFRPLPGNTVCSTADSSYRIIRGFFS
jgi:hypothetical protein